MSHPNKEKTEWKKHSSPHGATQPKVNTPWSQVPATLNSPYRLQKRNSHLGGHPKGEYTKGSNVEKHHVFQLWTTEW